MKKPHQFILLPTDKASSIFLNSIDNKMAIDVELADLNSGSNQHLYILSEDEIKELDWVYNKSHGVLKTDKNWCKVNVLNKTNREWWKIIATTDTELKIKNNFSDSLQNTEYFDESFYNDHLPSISPLDIGYIISLYNEKPKEIVEKLADDYCLKTFDEMYGKSLNHFEDQISIIAKQAMKRDFISGYNRCLKANSDKIQQLLSWIDDELKKEDGQESDGGECSNAWSDALYAFKDKIKSLTKEQPKTDTVMVEYHDDIYFREEKQASGKPKLQEGYIVIVKD